jgi:hypothetical protein
MVSVYDPIVYGIYPSTTTSPLAPTISADPGGSHVSERNLKETLPGSIKDLLAGG